MGLRPDVIVIGSGAGGGAAAWALTGHGLSVLLLEAGPRFDPARDYPLDQAGWERKGFPAPPGSRGQVLYGDLGQLDPALSDLASFDAAHPVRIGALRQPSASGYAHVMGVGGSTLHYVGEAHRLHPDSFSLRGRTGLGADWPLSYGEMEPFYTAAENLVGVAASGDGGPRWRSQGWPLPAHPPSPSARLLGRAAASLGWGWSVNPRAALSESRDGRPACNYCGQCSRGCPLGDKGSADVTFLAGAERTGLLDLRPNAMVTRLLRGPNARIVGVEAVVEGRVQRFEAPEVILAGGAVQTPRLLLAFADAEEPQGMANGSGQVGRNFMETLSIMVAGLAPDLTLGQRGLPADAINWDFSAPDLVDGAAGGFRLGNATIEVGLAGPIAVATRLMPGHGRAFKASMRQGFGSALAVTALGAVIPDHRSFVALSPDQRDAHGLPLPVIHSVLTENSLLLLKRMAEAARSLLAAAGVPTPREQRSSWDRFTATHVFGTCRMGEDRQTSVTNAFGRCHDYENLWIADASLFPGSGGGESPALTISALALRQAAHLAAR